MVAHVNRAHRTYFLMPASQGYQAPPMDAPLYTDTIVLNNDNHGDGYERWEDAVAYLNTINEKGPQQYFEILRAVAMSLLKAAEAATYRWFAECELDQGRIQAHQVYENVRRAAFTG